jgi:hypothetical protein
MPRRSIDFIEAMCRSSADPWPEMDRMVAEAHEWAAEELQRNIADPTRYKGRQKSKLPAGIVDAMLIDMYVRQKLCLIEIARICKCSDSSVRYHLLRHGVKMRPRGFSKAKALSAVQ